LRDITRCAGLVTPNLSRSALADRVWRTWKPAQRVLLVRPCAADYQLSVPSLGA
jgi:hypothetical protein